MESKLGPLPGESYQEKYRPLINDESWLAQIKVASHPLRQWVPRHICCEDDLKTLYDQRMVQLIIPAVQAVNLD